MIVRTLTLVSLWLPVASSQDDAASRTRYAEGLRHLEAASRLSGENRELDALRELEQAEKLLPPSAQLYQTIGGAYVKLADTRAATYLEKAVQSQPRDPLLHILLGEAYWGKSEFRKSLEQFRTAAALQPDSARAQFGIGYTHQLLGDYGSAKPALETALRLDPDLPLGNLAYGHLLAAEGKWEEATAFLTRFARKRPNDADVRLALAQIYMDHNRLDQAQAELESAASAAPEEKRVHYLLGRVYTAAGNKELADKEFAIFSRLEQAEQEKARRVKNVPYYSKP